MKIWDRKTFRVPRFLLQSDKQYQINNIHKKYLCLCSIQNAAIGPGLPQMVYTASCLLSLRKVEMVCAAFPSNIVHVAVGCVLLDAYSNFFFLPETGPASGVWNQLNYVSQLNDSEAFSTPYTVIIFHSAHIWLQTSTPVFTFATVTKAPIFIV